MADCDIKVFERESDLVIVGKFSDKINSNVVKYYAPSPPDYRSSYPGSALPFASEKQAFENTPNIGSVPVNSENKFEISLVKPNAFFNIDDRIEPYVSIIYKYNDEMKNIKVQLGDTFKHKTIQSNSRIFPRYDDVVESQENILKKRKFC
jgi:hypothetical protein